MLKGVLGPSFYEFSDQTHGFGLEYGGPAAVAADEAVFGSDEFRMYAYKIKRCPRTRSHDWTECPYAHRGEKAQRRDPRRHAYAAVVCPSFRAGASCDRGDACEFAHGVFEYWLHPSRYRTRACNSGRLCQRKVCFFAHSPDQLRRPEPSAAKLLRRGNYSYRARAAASAAAAASPPSSSSSSSSPAGLRKSTAAGNADDDSFEKFTEFLRSLRALKIGEDRDGEIVSPAAVVMSSGLNVSTESDLDLTHIEWVSELVN